ncbi:metallophosphoesterase [Streptomyces rhizosphaerihabitans]|uniref:metallophosphoesterase n=1 Tax=Streptomyces rhizosphaerihabitans TaxID=1266770 RepID=UPI0021C0E56B|nr:metallophosphoesterase [Streptomyces rhizosphaerihabitans]MCT9007613.1 metallophosphoesterase [Streptomyces rhizosphaerihabitans]
MVILFVLAGVTALAVLGGLHRYAWRRLIRDTTSGPGAVRRVGAAVFVAGPLLMIGAVASERAGAPFWLQRTLSWPGFLWMALTLYLVLALLAGELVRPVLRWAGERRAAGGRKADGAASPAVAERAGPRETVRSRSGMSPSPDPAERPAPAGQPEPAERPAPAGQPEPAERPAPAGQPEPAGQAEPAGATGSAELAGGAGGAGVPGGAGVAGGAVVVPLPSRRLFVSRVVGGAAAAVAVGTVGYGTYGVLRGPAVKRVTVPLAKLPRSAHGFRIAVVSDIHLGPVLGRGFAQKVVDTINSTQPDLIAVVGDLVDGSVKDLGPAAAPLARLRARHGSYFVTGNHEYFSGAEQWIREVRELGIHPLENARTELAGFDLAGVNDLQGESEGQGPDFGKALGDRDRTRACVLLAHQPVQIHEAVRHGVDLQLSGHTHGGQLWPGNFVAAAANPTLAGLDRYGDTQLYVSRGAGAWGPPTRVGAPSDITVVELASREA